MYVKIGISQRENKFFTIKNQLFDCSWSVVVINVWSKPLSKDVDLMGLDSEVKAEADNLDPLMKWQFTSYVNVLVFGVIQYTSVIKPPICM